MDWYISAEQLLYFFDADLPYKLYLLDIQMGEKSGMELARKIRERDKESVIIFLTGSKEYALEGYEVGALCGDSVWNLTLDAESRVWEDPAGI